MSESATLPLRSQVPHAETWDLESIFATPADWEAAGWEIAGYLPLLAAYQGRLKEGPQTLLAYLHLAETAGILAGKYMNYASNYYSVDTTDQRSAARLGQSRSLNARLGASPPESLLSLPP
jgi:oligoendopeptidase F